MADAEKRKATEKFIIFEEQVHLNHTSFIEQKGLV